MMLLSSCNFTSANSPWRLSIFKMFLKLKLNACRGDTHRKSAGHVTADTHRRSGEHVSKQHWARQQWTMRTCRCRAHALSCLRRHARSRCGGKVTGAETWTWCSSVSVFISRLRSSVMAISSTVVMQLRVSSSSMTLGSASSSGCAMVTGPTGAESTGENALGKSLCPLRAGTCALRATSDGLLRPGRCRPRTPSYAQCRWCADRWLKLDFFS